MPRYAIKIEYNGAPFVGWQRQEALPSVQGAIEAALQRSSGQSVMVNGAGRTDTGVHALGQVAHFDISGDWDAARLMGALNYHLKPLPVAISDCAAVDDEFHARFDAVERCYLFRILARRAPVVLDAGWVWHIKHRLDCAAMQNGANHLIGRHDFTTFRAAQCQAQSPIKTLDAIQIIQQPNAGGVEYRFTLRARSFLHNQVRSIIGSLYEVGRGKWQPDDMGAALRAGDRAACGPVSPPHGLYLTDVRYAQDVFTSIGSSC